jgi:hypothetical protein
VPFFGIDLLGQFHGSFKVGKKNRNLFAFPFQRMPARQYLFGQVFGCICLWRSHGRFNRTRKLSALMTIFRIRWQGCAAVRTCQAEPGAALLAKFRLSRIFVPA